MTKIFKLIDYAVSDFLIQSIDLTINLTQDPVLAQAKLRIIPNPASANSNKELILDGENMDLVAVTVNEKMLNPEDYQLTEKTLRINNPPQDSFILEATTRLGINTDLFGLYETEGTVLVKAETQGLRRLLYCLDRPDVLASYTTTIIADKNKYPILLANGIQTDHKELGNGIHSATWSDPFPKPSYLFALVAGNLQQSSTHFITKSGREIPIVFYVPPKATPKCDFAKEVIKKSMHWDESNFGIECDLPQHMVAGVDKYASGASEPTGLNLFNTENLFATPAIKTDMGILRVLEVIVHEYFHTLTGDRVTIRDWFNLTWKEGLTTFRAALFREDLFGTDLVRLLDGKNLDERAPRPDNYTAVRSLYTAAAYEKGADIFRMIMLGMGKETFYKKLSEFLKINYGTAVTIEQCLQFLEAQAYLNWFTQSGIPSLVVRDAYDEKQQKYSLYFTIKNAKSRPIPVLMGLLNEEGQELLADTLLILNEEDMRFDFENIASRPIPSLLRSFSAPVRLEYQYPESDLLVLMRHDTNLYNRCEAAKTLIHQLVREYCSGTAIQFSAALYECYRDLIQDPSLNHWLLAELLSIPSEEDLIAANVKVNFETIAQARNIILESLAHALKPQLIELLSKLQEQEDVTHPQIGFFDIRDAGKRRLMSVCCDYLLKADPNTIKNYLIDLFYANVKINMTNTTNALVGLCEINAPEEETVLNVFYEYWQDDTHAINYWFKIQAAAHSPQVVSRVQQLIKDPCFDITNPNKVNAVIATFLRNPYGFHALSGEGYALVADIIIQLDAINPALAGRLTEAFVNWKNFDEQRQYHMFENLKRIHSTCTSADVSNVATRGIELLAGSMI
ncbi:MAG: aminopeptidase N [Legionella sp.]